MTISGVYKIDYGDEATNKLIENYSNSNTCNVCSSYNGESCDKFDINTDDTFSCLSFKGKHDDI